MDEFRKIPSNDKILFGILIAIIVFNSMVPHMVEGLDDAVGMYNVTTPSIVTGMSGTGPTVDLPVMSVSGSFRTSNVIAETPDKLVFTFPANYFLKNSDSDTTASIKLTITSGVTTVLAGTPPVSIDSLGGGKLEFIIPAAATPIAISGDNRPNYVFKIDNTTPNTPIFKFGPAPIGITPSGFKIQSNNNSAGAASMPALYNEAVAASGAVDSGSTMTSRQGQMMTNIKSLQTIETELFAKLASESDPVARTELVTQINRIASARGDLYNNMNDFSGQIETVAAERRKALVQNSVAVDVIKSQIENAQDTLSGLKEDKSNKLRLVEINNYYGKKYEYQTDIMKIIIITCVPVLVISIALKKGFIPSLIATGLIAIIIAVGIIAVARKIIDLNKRNNFNFDQYDHPFNPNAVAYSNAVSTNLSEINKFSYATSCVGPYCCTEGSTVWDETTAKCIQKQSSLPSSTTPVASSASSSVASSAASTA